MITSTSNPQVKNLQQLKKKASARNEQDAFLVEGIKMFQEAPGERIQKLYVSKSLYDEKGAAFFGTANWKYWMTGCMHQSVIQKRLRECCVS